MERNIPRVLKIMFLNGAEYSEDSKNNIFWLARNILWVLTINILIIAEYSADNENIFKWSG